MREDGVWMSIVSLCMYPCGGMRENCEGRKGEDEENEVGQRRGKEEDGGSAKKANTNLRSGAEILCWPSPKKQREICLAHADEDGEYVRGAHPCAPRES